MRKHIYNIYGLVRAVDEIVNSYNGTDQREQLDNLERVVYAALARGYSANLLVHAFQNTAVRYGISQKLIAPFFDSMRTDITARTFTATQYKTYIHGSAEVVGLMCLRVFVNDETAYRNLQDGATALGAAFQKVNFLRDIAFDHNHLHRFYFPGTTYEKFDDAAKNAVVADIYNEFHTAKQALDRLPKNSRPLVLAAYRYVDTHRLSGQKLQRVPPAHRGELPLQPLLNLPCLLL